jgi:hypothetical protein
MTARASYLLHARGWRRGGAAVGVADLQDARGRRSIVLARGRSKPPVVVSDLLLHEFRILLANHGGPNVEKIIKFL